MIRLLAAAMLLLPVAAPCAEAPPDERIAAYQEFRHSFDAGDYAAALPAATRVVELTRGQFGKDAAQLANPLTNLGTTYYRMRRFGDALDSYREALTLLDLAGNATDERLVRPLHGLGAALRALDRDAEAIAPFRRAVEILRNREGLYTASQLPLMKELIGCYTAAGQLADASRDQQYAFTVAETAFGKDDLRLLGPLDDYAQWQEAAGQFGAARVLHARAVQLADAKLGERNLAAIPGLRGIARTYRLAFLYGETEESAQAAAALQDQLAPSMMARVVNTPSSEGERALRNALERVNANAEARPALRAEVLLDLGDWYLITGNGPRAMASYRDAWQALGAGAEKLLGAPQMLVYRPPAMAVSRHGFSADTHEEQEVQLRLAVQPTGEVREAIVMNPAPERESAERAVISALKRGLWRPGLRDGNPVAVNDIGFRERVFVRRPRDKETKEAKEKDAK
ncbi:MAG TPA: tetratricopeptide repeat protein [Steroidobacteraceae bacterium]|nr:tetratricopeptide repeat protein [Steroidobacteraceae bacterium]